MSMRLLCAVLLLGKTATADAAQVLGSVFPPAAVPEPVALLLVIVALLALGAGRYAAPRTLLFT